MNETAESLITDALSGIFAVGTEQPVEANDMAIGIRYLNRMMSKLDALGISLGYSVVSSPSDEITVSDGAISGMIDNLSIMLAPVYGEQVSMELASNAKDGILAMRKLSIKILPTQMPCTLPIGSGNESDYFNYNRFYHCPDDEILNEQEGSILLESN